MSSLILAAFAASPAAADAGTAQRAVLEHGLQGRLLWMDGAANLDRISTPEGMAQAFNRCKAANINTVILDVKPLSGHALYASEIAPRLNEWRGRRYPGDFDRLAAALAEGRRTGIKVHACINVFCEGHKVYRSGPIYDRPEQQSIVYEAERTVTAPGGQRWRLALGENLAPGPDEMRVFTRSKNAGLEVGALEAAAVFADGIVTRVIDGSLPEREPIAVPTDGCILVGRGAAAEWILRWARTDEPLHWDVHPRLVPITESPSEEYGMFVIPTHPEARANALSIVEEIVRGYDVDGITFDRMRYASVRSDFSALSRQQFEAWLGHRIERYPEDVYAYDPLPQRGLVRGPLFNAWVEWRARNIRGWLGDAVRIVRKYRPQARIGAYVGSWYSSYYDVGVNWAAEGYVAGYDWMSPAFPETGCAQLLDYLTTGCYYRVPTRDQARRGGFVEGATVQAAAELSTRVADDSTFVYAGLYLLDYQGNPDLFKRAVSAALEYSQGVMLFDMVYLDQYDWWGLLREALPDSREAPHDHAGLIDSVRRAKAAGQ